MSITFKSSRVANTAGRFSFTVEEAPISGPAYLLSEVPRAFHCSLQRDFPDHPLLREVAQRDSSRLGGDEASEYKFPSERKGKEIWHCHLSDISVLQSVFNIINYNSNYEKSNS